jgi:hypothetical protein
MELLHRQTFIIFLNCKTSSLLALGLVVLILFALVSQLVMHNSGNIFMNTNISIVASVIQEPII